MLIDKLPKRDKNRDPRTELDNMLGVTGWYPPTGQIKLVDRDPRAPAWWKGEEDASQAFLTAMGVRNLG